MQCSRLFYPSAWLPRRAMHCGQKVTRLFDIENVMCERMPRTFGGRTSGSVCAGPMKGGDVVQGKGGGG